MKTYLQNWNFIRAVRLVLGIVILVQGIMAKEYMYGMAGLLLSGMAIANIGCCGTAGCSVPSRKANNSSSDVKDISYEEVV